MVPIIASIVVPVVLLMVLPRYVEKNKSSRKYRPLLWMACFLYFISWYLYSPIIDGMETGFWTHFIGGGIFTGFIWLYFIKTGFWKINGLIPEIATIYALVSALGVLNELAEFFLVKTGLFPISLADTSWDLVTNTAGAMLFYVIYKVSTRFLSK